jgi:putative sterol carrier protein
MQGKYQKGKITSDLIYYFSIGEEKFTVVAKPQSCDLHVGKTTDNAHCVIKAEPQLFKDLVVHGKKPGFMDMTRGKIKISSMEHALQLQNLFGMKIL